MSWENRGDVWHLDHIKPLATATCEEDLIKLFHYTNFQPLLARDNIRKSSIYKGKYHGKKRGSKGSNSANT